MLYILLDNGHGNNTPGKRSPLLPDGSQFFEWEFCREVVDSLYLRLLDNKEFKPIKITPEIYDISLNERVNRINKYCNQYGAKNCIMISVHVNAAGNGGWMNGRGWSAWTTKGTTISDKLAACLYEGAEYVINQNKEYINSFKGQSKQKPIRTDWTDGDPDMESNFYITRKSNCCAVLTENFFMDNKQDVNYLLSPTGLNDIICIHYKGIENYYNKYIKK